MVWMVRMVRMVKMVAPRGRKGENHTSARGDGPSTHSLARAAIPAQALAPRATVWRGLSFLRFAPAPIRFAASGQSVVSVVSVVMSSGRDAGKSSQGVGLSTRRLADPPTWPKSSGRPVSKSRGRCPAGNIRHFRLSSRTDFC